MLRRSWPHCLKRARPACTPRRRAKLKRRPGGARASPSTNAWNTSAQAFKRAWDLGCEFSLPQCQASMRYTHGDIGRMTMSCPRHAHLSCRKLLVLRCRRASSAIGSGWRRQFLLAENLSTTARTRTEAQGIHHQKGAPAMKDLLVWLR